MGEVSSVIYEEGGQSTHAEQRETATFRSNITSSFWRVGVWLSSMPGNQRPWRVPQTFYSSRDEQLTSLTEALMLHAVWFHHCWVEPLFEMPDDSLNDEQAENRYFGSALVEETEWVRDFCKWACYQLFSSVVDDTCSISSVENLGSILKNQNYWAQKTFNWAKMELSDTEESDESTIAILTKLAKMAYFQGCWIQFIYGWLVVRLVERDEDLKLLVKDAAQLGPDFKKTEHLIETFDELLNRRRSEIPGECDEETVPNSNSLLSRNEKLSANIAANAKQQKEFLEYLSKNMTSSKLVAKQEPDTTEGRSSESVQLLMNSNKKKRRSKKKAKSFVENKNNEREAESKPVKIQNGNESCEVRTEGSVPVNIKRHNFDPAMEEIERLYTDINSIQEKAKLSDTGDCAKMLVVEVLGISFNPNVVQHVICDERRSACEPPGRCAPQHHDLWLVRPVDAALPDFPHHVLRTRLLCHPPGPPSLAVRMRVTTACRCVADSLFSLS